MKIKSQVILLTVIISLFVFFTGCSSSKGGKNCDCPKFGETNTEQNFLVDKPAS
ncbi:MAG: hypothetical protein ACKVPJ_00750 [Chitinophagales bacterium]